MKTIFQELGPYEIIQSIGHGMAGSVFLARDKRTDQRVALKLIPHGTDHEDREILAAERSGAELQRQLSQVSKRVPTVFEHGDHESGYYVAMEYLDGENLSSLISRGPMPAQQAAGIAIELCEFLEDAHHFEAVIDDRALRSLVHGDLTPRNVRITSRQEVKVLDFGIAKALSLSRKVTRNDFGTLSYLSPERLEAGVVDEYADYWAVGVMLYELVRGARPFQAEDTRRLERLILARSGAPSLNESCPRGLESVIAKLLAPTPAERYPTPQAIREDLERFRSGETTHAEQEGWPRLADEVETRRTQPPADAPDAEDDKTRRTSNPQTKQARPPARPLLGTKTRRYAAAVLLVLVLGIVGHESRIGAAADKVAAAAATQELEEIGKSWDQYDNLSQRSTLHIGTNRLGRSLTRRSTVLADRVIADYRASLPTVREAHWQSARDALARAVVFSPHDPMLRASLRYCEGHLHRINGEAKRARREFPEAQRDLTDAVAAFREAAELRRNWPDPFLGLARTFIYGLQDLDRGADALRQAERYGYTPGERETVQLADGYRVRGDTLMRNARQLSGMPQERDHVQRAVEAYRQALTLYLSIKDLSRVGANIRLTQRSLDSAELKLAEFSRPATEVTPEPVR
jgi:serine/threonine protein kinase/tetratricopeptide (TPR) repeat protein